MINEEACKEEAQPPPDKEAARRQAVYDSLAKEVRQAVASLPWDLTLGDLEELRAAHPYEALAYLFSAFILDERLRTERAHGLRPTNVLDPIGRTPHVSLGKCNVSQSAARRPRRLPTRLRSWQKLSGATDTY